MPADAVRVEDVAIPVSDGVRLAARIWRPGDAGGAGAGAAGPWPAVLEADPYRKNDVTASADATMHAWFAAHRYAAVKLDLRGSGDSEGLLLDEYLPQEQRDVLDVLRWLAEQPWCTGRVGMIGYSWGGFSALQVAAHAPPELAAIVSVDSTDDRYADDVHYMGGCVLASDMLPWSTTMLADCARPPAPDAVTDWRAAWRERLENAVPFVETWLDHQLRDAYWRQGSVAEDPAAIRCPVYLVGGWGDPYRNAVFRLLADRPDRTRALVGPWTHGYPHLGRNGEGLGFLQEVRRWWDRWLKDDGAGGAAGGIDAEPALWAWVPDPTAAGMDGREGRWVAEDGWPSARVGERTLHLGAGTLDPSPGTATAVAVTDPGPPVVDPGPWCPYTAPSRYAYDQQAEDARWRTFDTAPLPERCEILGVPRLVVEVESDRPVAHLAARLCAVAPDGTSTLVTRGVLNLGRRHGADRADPVPVGEVVTVTLTMNATAWTVPAGHRLRLALATGYWPWIWPTAEPVRLLVRTSPESRLLLPVRAGGADPEPPEHFRRPEHAPPLEERPRRPSRPERRRLEREPDGTVVLVHDLGRTDVTLPASGAGYAVEGEDTYRLAAGDPLGASVTSRRVLGVSGAGQDVTVEVHGTMTATATAYRLTHTVEAREGGTTVYATQRHASVDRVDAPP